VQRNLFLTVGLFVSCSLCLSCGAGKDTPRPLSKSELLALVAGKVLPDGIVVEILATGLNFEPDDAYVGLLQTAGANSYVLAAVGAAKHVPAGQPPDPNEDALLMRLSAAGKLLDEKKFAEAQQKLSAFNFHEAAQSATDFVIGQVLVSQRRYQEAANVYSEILHRDPAFPEVQTRLGFTNYYSGNEEESLRHSKAAITRNPNSPSPHLNAGLALQSLRDFDAAAAEIQQAIRCKPDFAIAYTDLGLLLDDKRDYDGAIVQYKKSLAINSGDVDSRYDLGVAYAKKGDFVDAIREYREVKRLDPQRLDARHNLAVELSQQDPPAAITEFRELRRFAPDFQVCSRCLADALAQTGRTQDAIDEYHLAVTLDPTDPHAHSGLGRVFESQKNYDAALEQYRAAVALDQNYAVGHADIGRALLLKKDYASSAAELKIAEDLEPADWFHHDTRGRALQALGDHDGAIAEYRESVGVAPKQLQGRLDLAVALESQGDWVGAIANFEQAAVDEAPAKPGVPTLRYDAQNQLRTARVRFHQHLADLRSTGRGTEAATLEAQLKVAESAPNLDLQFHSAMQESSQAVSEKRFNDAETSAKQAIVIASQIQPADGRLPEAVGQLGNVYAWRLDYRNAQQNYQRQLTLTEQLYGAQSPILSGPLQNLAMTALGQKDFATAESLFSRTLELNQKVYGENSTGAADALRGLAHIYSAEKAFDKSEAALLRATKIYQVLYGEHDLRVAIPLTSLCYVYDQWSKPSQSEACHGQLVSMGEMQFGPNSPYLVPDLTAEAHALRQLGRMDDAVRIEQRTQSIQRAQFSHN
jgi:tetratricopeptide (TPR) repeat protein